MCTSSILEQQRCWKLLQLAVTFIWPRLPPGNILPGDADAVVGYLDDIISRTTDDDEGPPRPSRAAFFGAVIVVVVVHSFRSTARTIYLINSCCSPSSRGLVSLLCALNGFVGEIKFRFRYLHLIFFFFLIFFSFLPIILFLNQKT